MLTILLHSSKTMRPSGPHDWPYQKPRLIDQAEELADYLKSLSVKQLETNMKLSKAKVDQTHELILSWNTSKADQRPAIDTFLGDIYSGLQVQDFNADDREYANQHLLILSGLYGGLRALDSIHPYRLEMGYKLPSKHYSNLYDFWSDSIAKLVPNTSTIINLSAVEYTKAVLPKLPDQKIISPKFLTISSKTDEPEFVTVHAKVARGAFASWLIRKRINNIKDLKTFDEIGYRYNASISSDTEPVFVCKQFGGLGLSVRLT